MGVVCDRVGVKPIEIYRMRWLNTVYCNRSVMMKLLY